MKTKELDRMMKVCRMCHGKFEKLAHSHIVPRGLIPNTQKQGKSMQSFGDNGKGRMLHDALWDENILCSDCEKKLNIYDTYGVQILRDAKDAQVATLDGTDSKVWLTINRRLLRGFLASLLWRFSVSQLQECASMFLGSEYENKIAGDILNNGTFAYVDSILAFVKSNFSEIIRPPMATKVPCDYGEKIDGWVLMIPGVKIVVSMGATPRLLANNSLEVVLNGEKMNVSSSINDSVNSIPFVIPELPMLALDSGELERCYNKDKE